MDVERREMILSCSRFSLLFTKMQVGIALMSRITSCPTLKLNFSSVSCKSIFLFFDVFESELF
jgi:hypothetical protein